MRTGPRLALVWRWDLVDIENDEEEGIEKLHRLNVDSCLVGFFFFFFYWGFVFRVPGDRRALWAA